MKQNFEKTEEKTETYLGDKIVAWREKWEEMNEKGNFENKSKINCHIYRIGSKWQPLNLGECNDGGKFTAVNQAVNQAKDFLNVCNKHGWLV
jgi:hypothetical protein